MSGNRISLPEYAALRESAGIGAISARAQIAVAGNDRGSFLQGLLTNDIQALTPGTGCYAAWLTPQGRMITDVHVLEAGDMVLLDVPAQLADTILQKLDQFLFSDGWSRFLQNCIDTEKSGASSNRLAANGAEGCQ